VKEDEDLLKEKEEDVTLRNGPRNPDKRLKK